MGLRSVPSLSPSNLWVPFRNMETWKRIPSESLAGAPSSHPLTIAGSPNRKLKWGAPSKRMRRHEPLCLGEEVQQLYSYNLAVDDSSSDDDAC